MYRITPLRRFIQIANVLTCVSSLLAVSTDGFSCTRLSWSLGSYGEHHFYDVHHSLAAVFVST
jgi:hypothetical protein